MAKDIIWFHAVYWPAMLMSAGLKYQRAISRMVIGHLIKKKYQNPEENNKHR